MNKMKAFQPLDVSLDGAHLVEASAGTGKTYSIALLFLRLVLEKKLPIESILVVTYTRAATAELKDRIRFFLAQAVRAFETGACREKMVTRLVATFREKDDARERLNLLREAILWLDESSVFTIHGFCQRVLGESAFETGQNYETEMVQNQGDLVREAVMDFYRRHIVPAGSLLVSLLEGKGLTVDELASFAAASAGRHLVEVRYPENLDVTLLDEKWQALKNKWAAEKETVREIILTSPDLKRNKENFKADVLDDLFLQVETSLDADTPASKALKKLTRTHIEGQTKAKGDPPQHVFFDICEDFFDAADGLVHWIRGRLLLFLRDELPRKKNEKNIQYYDDLLMRLYDVLKGPGGGLLRDTLRNQYKCALIDEFQDTDPVQYFIFNTIFNHKRGSLFLIGDPKQSIYAFRGADIFAYMAASRSVEARHTLDTNWRSETPLVEAFNELFDRDLPFLYDEIAYEAVKAGPRADARPLTIDGEKRKPLVIWDCPDDEDYSKERHMVEASRAVAAEAVNLLSADTRIGDRPLVPGDMAVLVQNWRQGEAVRRELASHGVPAIMSAVASVFDSGEAVELYRCLRAVAEPGDEGIVKGALITSLIGKGPEEVLLFNRDDSARESWQYHFRELNRLWNQRGFMYAFSRFMKENDIAPRLVAGPEGERRLTNVLHVMELLHRQSMESGTGPHHLVRWFSERLQEDAITGDEYELRLESDANAVTIVTIHRSKGLQYPVVFCPFLYNEAKPREKDRFIYHENEKGKEKEILQLGEDNPEGYEAACRETMAEQLRLFYVAVTRAEHRCYLMRATMKRYSEYASHYFLNDAPERFHGSRFIELAGLPGFPAEGYRHHRKEEMPLQCREFSGTTTSTWRVTSFSSLTAESHGGTNHESEGRGEVRDRDPFGFDHTTEDIEPAGIHAFPKGPRAGTALHAIFEEIDFTEAMYDEKISEVLQRYSLAGEDDENIPVVAEMVRNVLAAALPGIEPFSLREVSLEARLTEMEFFFPLAPLLGTEFSFFDESLTVNPVEGFIRGFIDSVVCHGGRYYIIDWKSNWLGVDASFYDGESLEGAMREHRYTLQYLLYTVALDRFLASRLKDYSYEKNFGGIFYVFLRGVQEGTARGIFAARPEQDEIMKLKQLLTGRE